MRTRFKYSLAAAAAMLAAVLLSVPVLAGGILDNRIEQIGLVDYVETIYDESTGLITSEANAVLQDEQGYIWIGSYGGLSRYNGHEFQNISEIRENAPKTGIRVLYLDEADQLWIGTNDAGIYLFRDETFYKITQIEGAGDIRPEALSVRSITEGKDGTVYIGTTNGLFTTGADMVLRAAGDERIAASTVENLLCDRNGAVWGSTSTSQIFVIRDGEVCLFLEREDLGTDLAYGLCQGEDGRIYVGTEGSYVMRLAIGDTYAKDSIETEFLFLDSRETVNDLYEDSQGKLWVCTDSGIGYLGEDDTFYKINGLSSNTIMTQMYEDYEGNLWFASSRRGVIKLTRNKFKHIGYDAQIQDQTVNTTVLYDHKLYIGTDSGLRIVDSQNHVVENELSAMLSGIRIRSMMCDSKDRLWISTYAQYGLICYDAADEKWENYTTKEGLRHDQVRMSLELENGDIAAATNGGVALIRDGRVIKTYAEAEGIQNEVILCLAQDAEGLLYAGSDGNGIYRIDTETDEVVNISVDDGLTSGVILRLVPDEAAEGIWVSNGSSVSLLKKDGIQTIADIDEGVGSVFDIKLMGDDIWLLKSFGLIQISREDYLAGNPVYNVITRRDGLTSSITANSWNGCTGDGMLFLCTGNGVYFLNLLNIQRNTVPPKVAVGSAEMDDAVYYGLQELQVPKDTQRVTLYLDILSFGIEGGSFEYYLEGFEDTPVTVRNTSANYVSYTNLRGGDYTFHLKGYNADGTPSEEITLPIHKEYSFFDRQDLYIWEGMGVLLLVLLIVVVAQFLNRRRILKRQKRYKEITDQTVSVVAKTIDAKDKYTDGHSHRVASYAVEIGRRFGLSKEELDQLYYSALLHDIGKIGIPDHILNKKGKLTDEEYAVIKMHPSIGGDILANFKDMPWIPQVARYHHERYDGRGYNEGLKGTQIPLFARIVAVADAYDAMNSTRIYRPAMTTEVIAAEIEKGKGTQFDPAFADIMRDMMRDGFEAKYES